MNAVIAWAPFLPDIYVAALFLAALTVLALAALRKVPDFYSRGILFLLLALFVLHPIFLKEKRQGLPDKLVIVMDDSASQKITGRDQVANQALEHIQSALVRFPDVEPVVIHSGVTQGEDSTALFSALRDNIMNIPLSQVAGTVFITDGQVHDVPRELGILEKVAPFHAVLTGKKDEFDRKVTIIAAPKYALLTGDVTISVKVESFGKKENMPVPLYIQQGGRDVETVSMMPDEVRDFTFKLEHPGQNVFEFTVPAEAGELTEINNTAPVIVNGIRDRLRVLLVSGSPHMGERAWRNLLKSDPSIDLVHFTILRSPGSIDSTPSRELSLIVFPVDELFDKKINDFDLIIFDHYQEYGLLNPRYFLNIASFVKSGGAFLMAMGSDKLDTAIFNTALSDILPVTAPANEESLLKKPYVPALTDLGKQHAVTGDLVRRMEPSPWSEWLTQADLPQTKGDTLMTGAEGKPLLILDQVTDGRVAVLTSDNVWIWSKGAGGPYTELLRNTAHWLMKEPELENDYIKAEAKGNVITVSERSLSDRQKIVVMTDPSGKTEEIALDLQEKGWVSAKVAASQNGIYRFSNGTKTAFVAVGTALNEEFSDVRTTSERLRPVIDKTHGALIWYQETPDFALRILSGSAGNYGAEGWLGLKRNGAYTVEHVESDALIPEWLVLLTLMAGLVFVWWRESGVKNLHNK